MVSTSKTWGTIKWVILIKPAGATEDQKSSIQVYTPLSCYICSLSWSLKLNYGLLSFFISSFVPFPIICVWCEPPDGWLSFFFFYHSLHMHIAMCR